tara:strand:- start:4338 stop:5768 length:1431 start_codon:yes stop_codon:yes gene_type:complete
MKKLFIFILTVTFLTSCTEDIQDFNINPKVATSAQAAHLFSYSQYNLAKQIANYDYNHNVSVFWANYATQTTYIQESSYNADDRDVGGNMFDNIYTECLYELMKARDIINSKEVTAAETPLKNNKLAMIKVLEVYAYQYLVDSFGNIPFTEALDVENATPIYDDAATIYTAIIADLQAAASSFDVSAGAGSFADADIIYGGDIAKWKKFAYTLHLKLGIRLADVDASKAQSMIQASVSAGIFDSNDDSALFSFINTEPLWSPIYDYFVFDSRNSDFVATETFLKLLQDLGDPRVDAIYDDNVAAGMVGGVYGAEGNSFASLTHLNPDWTNDPLLPGNMMDYSLAMFDLAEAAARGFIAGDAASYYNNGVEASFANFGLSDSAAAYLAANPYDAADWKKSIGTQKYIASVINPHEGWTESRRLGVPVLAAAASNGVANPKRMTYPIDEELINTTNFGSASSAMGGDKTSSAIFWDIN